MALLVVALAVAGWLALDLALVGLLMLTRRRRERRIRVLTASLIAAAERYTGEAAPQAAPVTGIPGRRVLRGPSS